MKKIILLVFVLVLLSCKNNGKRAVVGESEFQKEMNAKFKDASTSPLTKKGLKEFKSLDFFPINEKYKVTAQLKKTPKAPVFNLPTTTDRVAVYKKYGILYFTIDEKQQELAIFQDLHPSPEYANHLFLPFLDQTNGTTSYEGGRFIDVYITDIKNDGTISIDFNKAYNPYCAYSDRYSCPITPQENSLDVEIKAGVMAYKKS